MAEEGEADYRGTMSEMATKAPVPKFVLDEEGRKSEVILSIRDYERLLAAWEEIADAEDLEAARASATDFVTVDELRKLVRGKT